ncbi:tyrosine-type recombinase/integrase [Streptosporangium sp. NPDC049046]|uniref:tyrosine-type recombinase/integrase n=1 Tax=Streptosporangium sp. NPDC049046 TaxID=3155031 RepID=UPI00342E9048
MDGRADCTQDRRFRALVLLATFASLRWGEVSALRRTDVELDAGTVRIRATFIERSTGGLVLGPPKSKADRRTVGIPKAIVPALRDHLKIYVKDGPDALMFPGAKGGPLRRSGFNTRTRRVDVVKEMLMWSRRWGCLACTSTTFATRATCSPRSLTRGSRI